MEKCRNYESQQPSKRPYHLFLFFSVRCRRTCLRSTVDQNPQHIFRTYSVRCDHRPGSIYGWACPGQPSDRPTGRQSTLSPSCLRSYGTCYRIDLPGSTAPSRYGSQYLPVFLPIIDDGDGTKGSDPVRPGRLCTYNTGSSHGRNSATPGSWTYKGYRGNRIEGISPVRYQHGGSGLRCVCSRISPFAGPRQQGYKPGWCHPEPGGGCHHDLVGNKSSGLSSGTILNLG